MAETVRQRPTTTRQILTIVAAVVVFYFVAGVAGRLVTLYHLRMQLAGLQEKRSEILADIDRLGGDVSYMQTDSYIEQAARTMLLWGRPGEKLLISPDGTLTTSTTTQPRP